MNWNNLKEKGIKKIKIHEKNTIYETRDGKWWIEKSKNSYKEIELPQEGKGLTFLMKSKGNRDKIRKY